MNNQKQYEALKPVIGSVEKACFTKSHKQLTVLHKKQEERAKLYEDTPYTLANVKALDDMLKSEPLIAKAIQEYEDIIKESAKDGSLKGGGELSLSESGGLFE